MTVPGAPGAYVARRDADGRVSVARADGFVAERALVGKPIDEAAILSAHLHALCPHAHRIALLSAAEIANETPCSDDQHAARGYALLAEAAGAAAFRFGALWPMLLGHRPEPMAGKAWRAAQAAARAAVAGGFDEAAHKAVHQGLHDLVQPGGLAGRLIADAAALKEEPDLQRPGHSMFDRLPELLHHARALVLRVRDASSSANDVHCSAKALGVGRARAQVEVVRGLLDVEVSVRAGALASYTAQTPTDRVMAPSGPLAQALAQVRRVSTAPLVVMALDPCAPVALEIAPLAIGAMVHA